LDANFGPSGAAQRRECQFNRWKGPTSYYEDKRTCEHPIGADAGHSGTDEADTANLADPALLSGLESRAVSEEG
jgi:hypothetical protein